MLTTFLIVAMGASALADHGLMTPLNGNGNWAMVILGEPGDQETIYRICKNSQDRQKSATSEGSLAIICLSVTPGSKKASLGVWHARSLGKAGDNIPCILKEDALAPVSGVCPIEPSSYRGYDVIIADEASVLKRLLGRRSLGLWLGGGEAEGEPLVFDLDLPTLKKTAAPYKEIFHPWLPE